MMKLLDFTDKHDEMYLGNKILLLAINDENLGLHGICASYVDDEQNWQF